MTEPELVSIILPTYNRAELLPRAVNSVLDQTYPTWELLIWDDGSSDDTRSVVMGFGDRRVGYHYAENKGAAAARNQAVSRSAGQYVAFLDSDDQWSEDKLRIQVETLRAHPEFDIVFSNFINVNLKSNRQAENFSDYSDAFKRMKTTEIEPGFFEIEHGFLESLASGNYVATDSVVIKKDVFLRNGGFNVTLRNSEDYELWWRLGLNKVRIAFHDQVLMIRYKPEGSLTSLSVLSASNSLRALEVCSEEAIAADRPDLADLLKPAFRNAWQNMITARAMENDRKGMTAAFRQSLKYGFRPGSLRLLIEGYLKIGGRR